MSIDPTRRLALDILVQVAAGRPLASLLDRALVEETSDTASPLLVELVKGTIRWQGRYDHLIRCFSRRKFPTDPRVLNLLRLSLHQLIACAGIPAYAAIHQAGELGRSLISERVVPYVNGLLQAFYRHLASSSQPPEEAICSLFPPRTTDPAGFLATYLSHPRWLIDRWLQRYGFTACEALCIHNNRVAAITLHVLAPAGPESVRHCLQEGGLTVRSGRYERALVLEQRLSRQDLAQLLAGTKELIVQDAGAQEATAWLAWGGRGRLLDLCAAPGGKTFHLRSIWPAPNIFVAMDLKRKRLELLGQTAKRIEAEDLNVLLADGLAPPLRQGSFDAVLLDGPCSGTGVLRRHPEGRWRLRPEDLNRYRDRLLALAQQAAALLAPGGKLMYSTCSLEPEENEEVVAALLRGDKSLVPLDLAGAYQKAWLPQDTGTDGFFAARLGKRDLLS